MKALQNILRSIPGLGILILLGISCQRNDCNQTYAQKVESGDFQNITKCLELGLNPDSVDNSGRNLLEISLKTKNEQMVELLLQHNANPFSKNSRGEPLNISARKQNLKTIAEIFGSLSRFNKHL